MRQEYPDRIPFICEKNPRSKLQKLEKTKFLVPLNTTMSQLTTLIRQKVKLDKTCSLFILVGGKFSVAGDKALSEVYDKYKDPEDYFLYLSYTDELIWG